MITRRRWLDDSQSRNVEQARQKSRPGRSKKEKIDEKNQWKFDDFIKKKEQG